MRHQMIIKIISLLKEVHRWERNLDIFTIIIFVVCC